MNTTVPAAALSPAKVAAPVAQLLALDLIHPDPNQPRKAFDEASLKELAESIKAEGLIQPLVVRPNGKGYHIVAGERRFRAAKVAGLKEVPALVRSDLKDQDVSAIQLVENLQREDLALAEQCDAVVKLVKALGSARGAAAKLGKSEAWVSKRAGVEAYAEPVKKLLREGKVVDLEVAGGVNELLQVDAKDGQELLQQIAKPNKWDEPVDREEVRERLRWAKEQKEREQLAAREKAAADKDPKAIAAKDKEAKENEKHRAKEAAVKALNKACEDLAKRAMEQLFPKLGFKLPKRAQYDGYEAGTPLFIDAEGHTYSRWNPSTKYPATADGATFCIGGFGGADHLERIAKLFGQKPEVPYFGIVGDEYGDVSFDLDYDETLLVLKALKSKKGIGADFAFEMSGAALRKVVEKMTGKPLAAAATAAKPVDTKPTKKAGK